MLHRLWSHTKICANDAATRIGCWRATSRNRAMSMWQHRRRRPTGSVDPRRPDVRTPAAAEPYPMHEVEAALRSAVLNVRRSICTPFLAVGFTGIRTYVPNASLAIAAALLGMRRPTTEGRPTVSLD